MWHNFIKVRDNWIKVCSLTCNRCVNLDQKLPTVWEKCQKMPACVSADDGHFEHTGVNWVVALNMA